MIRVSLKYQAKIVSIFLSLSLFNSSYAQKRKAVPPSRYEQLSGVKTAQDGGKHFWDKKYSSDIYVYGKTPAKFLAENYNYLPLDSAVLDIGMGEGRNAVFLAKKKFNVTGIDISSVAVKKAQILANEHNVKIKTIVASLNEYDFKPESFNAIISFYYVDRTLIPQIIKWLKPGGVLIYEAHTLKQRDIKGFERMSTDYLLQEGELLNLFPGMDVLKFEEPTHKQEFTSSIILKKK